MVNKCSVAGCKSLYVKDNVKLHRFPLTNAETLPLWITATGREKGWKPCKSSRLCGNHFKESEYIIGHGKGVLKSTAIPTIEYRVNIPRYTKRRRHPHSNLYDETTNKRKAHEQTENDSNIEIVQVDYNDDINDISKIEKGYQNEKDNSCDDHEKISHEIKDTEENTNGNDDSGEESCSYDETVQNENFNSDIFNRKNQCYMFTSSFKEDMDILTPPEDKTYDESSNMSVDQTTAISNSKQIIGFKEHTEDNSLYSQSSTKVNVLEEEIVTDSFDDEDMAKLLFFIESEMKELLPYKKLYTTTKYQIQKLLMKAKLKIVN